MGLTTLVTGPLILAVSQERIDGIHFFCLLVKIQKS